MKTMKHRGKSMQYESNTRYNLRQILKEIMLRLWLSRVLILYMATLYLFIQNISLVNRDNNPTTWFATTTMTMILNLIERIRQSDRQKDIQTDKFLRFGVPASLACLPSLPTSQFLLSFHDNQLDIALAPHIRSRFCGVFSSVLCRVVWF